VSCQSSHGSGSSERVDERAAMDVLLAHRGEFVDFVAARVDGRAVAEDLVQEALARALESVDELRSGDAVLGWFYRILRNAIIDGYRRRSSSVRGLERLASEATVEETESPQNVCQCVSHLAQDLKPEYAEALRRVEVEGTPVKTLAEELGISANNAAVRVFRARESLRKKVMATCRACAEAGCMDCTCGQGSGGIEET
jgi:RNA polymerase sigma factor (sigma-70 family)